MNDVPAVLLACNRGRTAGYPAAPSQIPACGFPAQGSSALLASYRYIFISPLLFPAVWFAYVAQPVLSAYVSSAGFAVPSSPSPCDRRYRLRVL